MIRNVRVWICVACLASSLAAPAPMPYPLALDIIDLAAISRMSPQQLEKLAEGLAAEEIMRTKRSSAQALTAVVSKASGLQSKVSLLGQASAGAATLIASASSKTGGHSDEHGYSYEPQSEKYDYWGLKKSIFYTLFQAVKAITGGVTILKGQLIKGGGALAATLGKVISVKGDAVSNLGKKIVSSAALSHKKPHSTPVYGPPPPPAHVEYAPPPSGYGAPTAPAHYSHTGPSAPTGFAAHKYPAHLDEMIVMSSVTGDDHSDSEPPPFPSQHLMEKYYDMVNEIWNKSDLVHKMDYYIMLTQPTNKDEFVKGVRSERPSLVSLKRGQFISRSNVYQSVPIYFHNIELPHQGAVLGTEDLQHYYV